MTTQLPPTLHRRCQCGGCTNGASYETKLETVPVPLASCDEHVAFLWWLIGSERKDGGTV